MFFAVIAVTKPFVVFISFFVLGEVIPPELSLYSYIKSGGLVDHGLLKWKSVYSKHKTS